MSNISDDEKFQKRTKIELMFLRQVHIYGISIIQIIASAILISFVLWLIIRIPEPEVTVTGFAVDGLNNTKTSKTSLLHYNITLHNPDLYKSITYDVLFMRVVYSNYDPTYCGVVNFNADRKGVHQGPRETTVLANHSLDYTADGMEWVLGSIEGDRGIAELTTIKSFLKLSFVMQTRVLGTIRQRMRTADLYFDDFGNAFINPRIGLKFK